MKKIIQLYIAFLFLGFSYSNAQQEVKGLKQIIELDIDELGNAEMTMKMKLDAQQWNYFKSTMGNNQAELKRTIERGMPAFYLSDFKYEEEPMDRAYTLSLKAKAVTKIDKNGKWYGELDMKDPDISKVNETEYRLDMNILTETGGFINQTQIIRLPKKAKNSNVEKDSFGKAIITYNLDSGSTGSDVLKYAGGIMALAGLGLLFFKFKKKETEA